MLLMRSYSHSWRERERKALLGMDFFRRDRERRKKRLRNNLWNGSIDKAVDRWLI